MGGIYALIFETIKTSRQNVSQKDTMLQKFGSQTAHSSPYFQLSR